jgi:hypothetical protein
MAACSEGKELASQSCCSGCAIQYGYTVAGRQEIVCIVAKLRTVYHSTPLSLVQQTIVTAGGRSVGCYFLIKKIPEPCAALSTEQIDLPYCLLGKHCTAVQAPNRM